jgi:hypothetical protein|tara:strand:+ start:292 stop:585 length:294 start_codon:yes stop_codon:yes gene_type:complete
MVVKLVEVHSHHAVTSNKSYTLREVFINPQRVVSMREDTGFQSLLSEGELPEGMNDNQTFTRIFLDQGQGGRSIVVVGDPMSVDRVLTEGQTRVLRG